MALLALADWRGPIHTEEIFAGTAKVLRRKYRREQS